MRKAPDPPKNDPPSTVVVTDLPSRWWSCRRTERDTKEATAALAEEELEPGPTARHEVAPPRGRRTELDTVTWEPGAPWRRARRGGECPPPLSQ
jgi:hypothetical protein